MGPFPGWDGPHTPGTQPGHAPFIEDGIELIVIDLDAEGHALDTAPWELLSPDEQERASRLEAGTLRRRWVSARAHLRRLLGQRLNMDPRDIRFSYAEQGKPSLSDLHLRNGQMSSPLHFNISHSGHLAAYAFSEDAELGVDIECMRPLRDADRIAQTLFAEGEYEDYRTLGPDERMAAFFACWTRKEAFLKATARGLYFSLRRFEVTLRADEPARLRSIDGQPVEGWKMRAFRPAPDYAGALVIRSGAAETLPEAAA